MDEPGTDSREGIAAALGLVSSLLGQYDWDDIVAGVERAEALGPILAPTAYRDSIEAGVLDRNRRIAVATRDYVAVLRQIDAEQRS